MWRKLLNRLRRDAGDTILITSVICAPIIALMFGLAADTAKNVYTSNYYHTVAQASAETAVKEINAKGHLDYTDAIPAFINEFKKQTTASESHTGEANTYTGRCSTAEIDGVERKLPYYEIKLSTGRGVNNTSNTRTFKFEDGQPFMFSLIGYMGKFRVIDADVYTSTGNVALSMFGQPCQIFKSSVSAIAFGDNVDLEKAAPNPIFPTSPNAGKSTQPPGTSPDVIAPR